MIPNLPLLLRRTSVEAAAELAGGIGLLGPSPAVAKARARPSQGSGAKGLRRSWPQRELMAALLP